MNTIRSPTCLIHGDGLCYTDTGRGFLDSNGCKVNCTCQKFPPPPPTGPLIRQVAAGGLGSMTGAGGLRTLTGVEEEYEAFKAAEALKTSLAKSEKPVYQPPRDAWWWSARVERLYQEYIKSTSTNQLYRSGNCNPYCNCDASRKCGDWVDESQFFSLG